MSEVFYQRLEWRQKILDVRVVDVLNEASYLEAAKLLRERGDLPLMLFVQDDHVLPEFAEWLWDNHRVTSFMMLPVGLLNSPSRWALSGNKFVVLGGLT